MSSVFSTLLGEMDKCNISFRAISYIVRRLVEIERFTGKFMSYKMCIIITLIKLFTQYATPFEIIKAALYHFPGLYFYTFIIIE